MGSGRTGAHHYPIEVLFSNDLLNMLQRVEGASMSYHFAHSHLGKPFSILNDMVNLDKPADILPAITDKNSYPGILTGDIPFRQGFFFIFEREFLFGLNGFINNLLIIGGQTSGRTGLNNGFRNVLRALGKTAHVDPGSGSGNGIETGCPDEIMFV